MTNEDRKLRRAMLRNRIVTSRPGMAWNVLRGRSTAYRIDVTGGYIGSQTTRGIIRDCVVRSAA